MKGIDYSEFHGRTDISPRTKEPFNYRFADGRPYPYQCRECGKPLPVDGGLCLDCAGYPSDEGAIARAEAHTGSGVW